MLKIYDYPNAPDDTIFYKAEWLAEEVFDLTWAERDASLTEDEWYTYKTKLRLASKLLWEAGNVLGESPEPVYDKCRSVGFYYSLIFSLLLFSTGVAIGFFCR